LSIEVKYVPNIITTIYGDMFLDKAHVDSF